jgi:GT2 family glycosyltransferase
VNCSVIDAVLVNWNGRRYLPRCLTALRAQTVPLRLVVVDNASTDGSAEYLRAEHPDVELLELRENRGYAGGANAGLQASTAEYVIILNPDIVLAPNHLEVARARLEAVPSLGIMQGRLHQVRPNDYVAGRFERASPLDSAGHRAVRTRMVYDRGQGTFDDQFDQEEPVFSACGAALFLRRSMLADIAIDGEYFDESFFAYKEDIDLCWRARLRGWDVRYIPDAVGWHVRGWAGGKPPSPHTLPFEARFHSFKNHYLLMLKNDTVGSLIRHLPWIVGWELLRQAHALLRDRSLYRVYPELLRMLPAILKKRRRIMAGKRVSPAEIHKWFTVRS